MLVSLGDVVDENVVDLYAGSGSFGIESLSRGARHATFVEQDREAQGVLAKNLETLGFTQQATIIGRPVLRTLSSLEPAGIVFCDPPYAEDPWTQIWEQATSRLVVGHAESPIALAEPWQELKRRKYGRSHILIAQVVSHSPSL